MDGVTESGITLDSSEDKWFRFERSKPYSDVSGFGFKEMDACLVVDMEDGGSSFYAIELKDYTSTESLTDDNMAKRIWDIVKKNVDTIQMFLSAKYQNRFGIELESYKNVDLHTSIRKARFITIINVNPENAMMLQTLKDKCLGKLCAYSKVWDDISITLMTKEQAQKHLAFVK